MLIPCECLVVPSAITPTSNDLMWDGLSLCPDANTQAVKQASTAIVQVSSLGGRGG